MILEITIFVIVFSFMVGFMGLSLDESFGIPTEGKPKKKQTWKEQCIEGLMYAVVAFFTGFGMLLTTCLFLALAGSVIWCFTWLFNHGIGGLFDIIWNGAQ